MTKLLPASKRCKFHAIGNTPPCHFCNRFRVDGRKLGAEAALPGQGSSPLGHETLNDHEIQRDTLFR